MSNALGNLFQDIADAIKEKTGDNATMKPAEFASNILAIENAAEPNLQNKTITENGTYTADDGYDGLASVIVNVAASGGGGSGNAQISSGNFVPSSNEYTFEHNLGVIPDIMFVYISQLTTSSSNVVLFAVSFSARAKAALNTTDGQIIRVGSSNTGLNGSSTCDITTSDAGGNTYGTLRDATTTTAKVGGSTMTMMTNKRYFWMAITGLFN